MPFKLKMKINTRQLTLEEVVNDDNENPGQSASPPARPIPVSIVQIFRETSGSRCWYVHEPGGWWSWRSGQCEQYPILRIKTNQRGRIRNVAYKVGPQDWRELASVNKPASASLDMELEIVDGDDEGLVAAVCRYVIIGGRPVKVCR